MVFAFIFQLSDIHGRPTYDKRLVHSSFPPIHSMSSRLQPTPPPASESEFPSSNANSSGSCFPPSLETDSSIILSTESPSIGNVWVDPASLPNHGDIADIAGNAPAYVKQLTINTLASYGVGHEDCFAQAVGKTIKIVEVNVNQNPERRGRLEAVTIAEVVVSKSTSVYSLSPFTRLAKGLLVISRYAEWGRDVARWMHSISH
jgi:hypothetical protein